MSASTRWLAAVGAALPLACQASPPALPPPPPPISDELLERFRLDERDESPTLAPIHVLGASPAADEEGVDAPSAVIELDDVLDSVEVHFPLILAALEEVEIAQGRLTSAEGGFDTRLRARADLELDGYYQSDRFDVGLEQPTALWGSTFSGGYRLGTGDFAVYDGKAKTNDGGEFRLGVTVPLLQGRRIDPRRVQLWSQRLALRQAEPIVLQKRLEATRKAADAYWRWVSWGRRREVAVRLLALAEDRMEQIELAVEEGLLAPINRTENERLIVDRRTTLLKAQRGLQEASIRLSLYWRDAEGRPAVPSDDALPYEFPVPRDVAEVLVPDSDRVALARRPEVRGVELELARQRVDRDLADNGLLPELDLGVFASQDVGGAVSTPDDNGPFELEALVNFQVPIQRRSAKGKRRELDGKIKKLRRELQLLRETVVTEVQDTSSELSQSWLRIGQARENVRLAAELAEAERLQLREGESDLLRVNLREQQAALAASGLVDALEAYFRALTRYRAVLGIPHEDVGPPSA